MNKLILSSLIGLLMTSSIRANDLEDALGDPLTNARADSIPAGITGYSYVPGAAAGNDSIPIPNFSQTIKFAANVDVSMFRSCGQLNPFENFAGNIEAQAEEKIDAVQEIAKAIPQLIVDTAVEYAMAKVNSTLFYLFDKKIDEYIKIFEIHVKSCEDVREDMAVNADAGIFGCLFQVAVADQWELAIDDGSFDNSRRFKEKLTEKAQEKGIKIADGNYYGGKDTPPINFIDSIATAGLNTIAGRNTRSDWDTGFSAADKEEKPITSVFNDSDELVDFLEDIYGSKELSISEEASEATSTKAGVGYYRRYYEDRIKNLELLKKYVNLDITRSDFEAQSGFLIPPVEIDDLRNSEPYERTVEIERISKEKTIEALEAKLLYAKAALTAGINAPDMVQSKLHGVAEEEYKDLYFRILDDMSELSRLKY